VVGSVDNTFAIWPHGRERLTEFLDHLNGLHNNIKFTMEIEEEGHLPFLDVDIQGVTGGTDQTLGECSLC